MRKVIKFLKNENGTTVIEYGLIITVISLMLIGGAKLLGPAVTSAFNKAGSEMSAAAP